jgi:hypothetical protein
MANPASREQLKQYCLRKLGAPVLEINVDDDQLEDLIDDALQYFNERHFDGMEKMYLKHQFTAEELERFRGENTTHTSEDGSEWEERNNYIELPDHIVGIERVFSLSMTALRSDFFGFGNQYFLMDMFSLNSGYSLGNVDLVNYYMFKQYFETLDTVLNSGAIIQSRFTKRNGKLFIDYNPLVLREGNYFIIECHRLLNPADYPKIWNDWFLKRYVTGLFKKQWGQNLIKFNGVQLPGGVSINGRQLFEDALREIDELESKMISDYELPPLDAIG